jgi:hypothetical protein
LQKYSRRHTGPREKSKRKTGATYEYDYNHFHCALFGAEVEISGRRFKKNEELVDQYLADYRSALQCFLLDLTDRSTAQRTPEGNSLGKLLRTTARAAAPRILPARATTVTRDLRV